MANSQKLGSDLRNDEKDTLRSKYQELRPFYERLATCLRDAIKVILDNNEIPYLDVVSRVKDIDSALGKIQRKQYSDPLSEIEDWCGIRVICYYPTDVDRICAVMQREFDVHKKEDTALRLQSHEFGYRSTHLIVKIKESWLNAPGYRGLGTFKGEVQVRTILMHAWAEVEHKLAYKSAEQVPDQFKRKLYRLSAKFEEADEQFEELRVGLKNYRESIKNQVSKNEYAFAEQELNLDTLQAFLDFAFPERSVNISNTSDLLAEINDVGLAMSDLVDAFERTKNFISDIERLRFPEKKGQPLPYWTQVGAMRGVLDIVSDKFYESRIDDVDDVEFIEQINAGRELFKKLKK